MPTIRRAPPESPDHLQVMVAILGATFPPRRVLDRMLDMIERPRQ